MANVVDLPAPFTPRKPKHSPFSTRKQRSATASFPPKAALPTSGGAWAELSPSSPSDASTAARSAATESSSRALSAVAESMLRVLRIGMGGAQSENMVRHGPMVCNTNVRMVHTTPSARRKVAGRPRLLQLKSSSSWLTPKDWTR
eukprot:scaffold243473_cov26-Tisochrysis_lutea.AAC.7